MKDWLYGVTPYVCNVLYVQPLPTFQTPTKSFKIL